MLLVDDEKTERDCVRFLITEFQLPIEIREAANGQEALVILKNWHTDILCADVQMPVMDGLELSKKALSLHPDIQILIFSGYAEFEYARTAILLGAVNYILKPIVPDELKNTVMSIIQQIEQAIASRKNQKEQHSLLLQYTLQQIINENYDRAMLVEVGEELFHFNQLILMEFEYGFLENNYADLYDGLRKDLNCDMESLNISPVQSLIFFRYGLSILPQQIFNYIDSRFHVKPYIFIGRHFSNENTSSSDAAKCLQEAYSALEQFTEQRFWSPSEHIYLSDSSFTSAQEPVAQDDTEQLGLVKQALSFKDASMLNKALDAIFEKYTRSGNQSQIFVKFVFSNLITALYPAYSALPLNNKESLEQLITTLYVQQDISKIINTIRTISDKIAFNFAQNNPAVRKEIRIVLDYIHTNYSKELSVEILASIVYLTPDYIGRLFKKSTGKGLSQYIRQYRMEQASGLLLHTTQKIIDIGVAVGYPNYSYFCQSFREYWGKSPEKFRQEVVK